MGKIVDEALAAYSASNGWKIVENKSDGKKPKTRAAIPGAARPKKYRRRGYKTAKKLCTDISVQSAQVLRAVIKKNLGQAEAVETALKFYFGRHRTVERGAMEQFLAHPLPVGKWPQILFSLPFPPEDGPLSQSLDRLTSGSVLLDTSIFLAAIIKEPDREIVSGSGIKTTRGRMISESARNLLERCKDGLLSGFFTSASLFALAETLPKLLDKTLPAKASEIEQKKLLDRISFLLGSPLKLLDVIESDFREAVARSKREKMRFHAALSYEAFSREVGEPRYVATWSRDFDSLGDLVFKPRKLPEQKTHETNSAPFVLSSIDDREFAS